jgi:hypothetical protein
VGGVAGVRHQAHLGVAADEGGHARRRGCEPLVVLAGHEQHGRDHLAQAVPQRLLRAGACEAEAGGQRTRVVLEAGVAVLRLGERPAKRGRASQRSRKGSSPSSSSWRASASSAATRAARSAGSSIPAVAPRRTRARTASGRWRARCRQARPPIE